METKTKTKASSTAKKTQVKPEKLEEAYISYLLMEGHRPGSIFKFARDQKISESTFYSFFSSFDALEGAIWKRFIEDTILTLDKDEAYAGYTVREKLLAFYYTHIEVLKNYRSFVLLQWDKWDNPARTPVWLKSYRSEFLRFVGELVGEAIETGEIKERPLISDQYHKAFWIQLGFVLNYWVKDDSKDFENTDAAIEKAVNLSLDLLGQTTLDDLVDFARFIYSTRK